MNKFEILKDRSVIEISGLDAIKFLQNYTTNDIVRQVYSYNFMLNNQGRYLFDFFVYNQSLRNDQNISLYVEISSKYVENFIKKLNLYKLRADVKITDVSSKISVIYLKANDTSESKLESFSESFLAINQDPRFNHLGKRGLLDHSQDIGNSFFRKLLDNPSTISFEYCDNLYLEDKYRYSIIDGDIDLVQEKSIPIEFAAEELNAISFTKGCYIGQEVISRAKYQGVIRKKIYKIEGFESHEIEASAHKNRSLEIANQQSLLFNAEGNKIGMVLSSYGNTGIAQVKEELLTAVFMSENLHRDGQITSKYNKSLVVSLPIWFNIKEHKS